MLFSSAPLAVASHSAAQERNLPTTVHTVEGLSSAVEILVDPWGVPHIYADQHYDVFFGQGWNAARDRLWQLDLWKRRGDGTLSEVFGSHFIEKDRAARLFLFRGDMHAEWLAYASDTKRVVTSFVAGVNSYIQLTRQNPERLPFEFETLDYAPALWTPETVVRIRSHGLLWNAVAEASRARFVRDYGTSALAFREKLEPSHVVAIPAGLDLQAFPDDALKVYDLAKSGVSFDWESKRAVGPAESKNQLARHSAPAPRGGSNNWVVAPARTSTGRPILANDPHRALSVPSLRYISHLSAPGLDAIGGGEPVLPGISIGHNRRIAFGLTIFYIDQEDLYVYETRPGKPTEYRYRDRWEPMRTLHEAISVRGEPDVRVLLKFTRHGPVIYEDPERHLAIGVRAAWLEPGMAPYLGGIGLMRAQNFDQFLAEMNRWGLPAENQVYADIDGNIGWKPGGLAPVRPNWDGLLPVPGDGRYEWSGFRNMDELPVEHNPKRGWIATANHMNLPDGYPHALGFEWVLPYRFERIREVMRASERSTIADMVKLQMDYSSTGARRVVALLRGLKSTDPVVQRAIHRLGEWNGSLESSSGMAALFEIWFFRHLARAAMASWVDDEKLLDAVLDEDELYDVFEGSNTEVWISRLEDPGAWRGDEPLESRNRVLLTTLAAAVGETERLLGSDWNGWAWGRLHKATLRHPLSSRLEEDRRAAVDVGPAPRGGSGATVNSTSYSLSDFEQRYGASFRMVVDVGAWDESRAMNSPGQSGDPSSPHYRDLFESWAADETFPLLFNRVSIEAVAERRIVLEPRRL